MRYAFPVWGSKPRLVFNHVRNRLRRPLNHRRPGESAQTVTHQWLAACPGLTLHDADGRLLTVNERAAVSLGIDGQSALGLTFAELGLPAAFVDAWEKLRSGRKPHIGEFHLGDRVLGFEFTSPDDATSICLWRDITQAWQVERHLQGRDALFASLFAHAPVGMAILDANHRYADVNPALCAMLGYSADEMKALPYAAMHHPQDARTELIETSRLVNGDVSVMQFMRRYTTKNGRDIWTTVTGTMCQDRTGAMVGMLRIIIDLTNKHILQEHERVMADLRRSNRDLERYATIASHDLQEPVRMVATHLSLVLDGGSTLDEKSRRHLSAAAISAVRMRSMIKDLMEYARLVTSDRTQTTTAIVGLVAIARSSLADRIAAAGAVVEFGQMPTMMVDSEQITSVFTNLLSNALKFRGDDPPRVLISAEPCDEGWRFEVADNGIGVPPEHNESVFGIFSRLHSRELYAGTGIGLALCRKIIEGHGGRIWLESDPGRSTRIKFILPTIERRPRLSG